jgi:radical SAM superfamily enzyme YgiQ (UPF0313 family)
VPDFKYLLITPPFTQLNTAYPAAPYLARYLRSNGISAEQADLSIETVCAIFSAKGLARLAQAAQQAENAPPELRHFLRRKHDYISKVDTAVSYLQGRDYTLADRIVSRRFLPEGPRFAQAGDTEWAFGTVGTVNHAKYLCTLFMEDIADAVRCIDPHFGFSRYAETIAASAPHFSQLEKAAAETSFATEFCIELLNKLLEKHQPDAVALSVPFPGNMLMALRCALHIKKTRPGIKIALGGGYANTELREVTDKGLFSFIDYLCLDDGELPLQNLAGFLSGRLPETELVRCFYLSEGQIKFSGNSNRQVSHAESGWPDYQGLDMSKYMSFIEMANPMHRLWSDGRWNKMTLAHGCYWARCSFCDTSLDYIKRYSQAGAAVLCDRIEEVARQTGCTGFHFVDEAAPPALLRELSLELIRRRLNISWWANIRFDKAFTPDMCRLMSMAGCIAASGGLEAASDRVLALINKNVNIEQAAKTCYYLSASGIMVHAYLMYGFPGQTEQETVDALEVVRQMMEAGIVHSGFWHRFTLTEHSPIAADPSKYGVSVHSRARNSFANNDLKHTDPSGNQHGKFADGLKKAIYNYMHGNCFEVPAHKWLYKGAKPASLPPQLIDGIIAEAETSDMPPYNKKLYYLGQPVVFRTLADKSGKKKVKLTVAAEDGEETVSLPEPIGWWLEAIMPSLELPAKGKAMNLGQLEQSFLDAGLLNFSSFLYSPAFDLLCKGGLVIV